MSAWDAFGWLLIVVIVLAAYIWLLIELAAYAARKRRARRAVRHSEALEAATRAKRRAYIVERAYGATPGVPAQLPVSLPAPIPAREHVVLVDSPADPASLIQPIRHSRGNRR